MDNDKLVIVPNLQVLESSPNQLEPLLVTIDQAAKLLNVSRRTIEHMVYTGAIDSIKCGREQKGRGDARRIVYGSLKRWVEERLRDAREG
jgi:excisionase family DNA binding protein